MRSEDAKERARDGRGFGRDEMFEGLIARASRARTTSRAPQRRRESIFQIVVRPTSTSSPKEGFWKFS
jgi:hypothetical protein